MPSSSARRSFLSVPSEKDDRIQWLGGVDDSLCWRLTPRFLCFESAKCEGSGASPSLLSSDEEEDEVSCIRGGGSRFSAASSLNKELSPPNSFFRRPFRSRV